jgi:indolepyruvate ferredoxin oxidoreductase
MHQLNASLDDKYVQESGPIYLTGIQALVRLLLMQHERDELQGLNTAAYVSGYRGSPLALLDLQLWRAQRHLDRHNIHFQPGVNEELAAVAIAGSQQGNLFPGARYDGVFSMWYGKGPGVDRSGDAFKHGNSAGASRRGGVLVIAGDDHACTSSTLAHQSEFAFVDAMMPVLNPAGVQEILDFGILGWAMSRYSGAWVAMKASSELLDSAAVVDADLHRVTLAEPQDFDIPPGGLGIRWPDTPLEREERLHRHKIYAARAFGRANHLDRIIFDSPRARLGIVTTGKSYLDVRQALLDIGLDEQRMTDIGLRLYKIGMTWPLESGGVRAFAEGLEEVLVIEEKRALIENQLKEQLYNWQLDVRPRVVGKFDETGAVLLPSNGVLTPARIARVIAGRMARFHTNPEIEQRIQFLEGKGNALVDFKPLAERAPYFCSGCPHNTSTKVPEGSQAMAGIGCHYMATWMNRDTATFTPMGGEGASWIGMEPFTDIPHMFQNMGDGTYFHSGILAIRAALAAKANITFKILYNDAVAMTGGQPMDGSLTVPQITHQLYGEGVRRMAVVTDEPDKYTDHKLFAKAVSFHHRREMDVLQRELREYEGVSALIYDQVCAAEKRRRRKRGVMVDPPKRVFINEWVCEGCGDCSQISNCLSVIPKETEFGRKRSINQGACNKDFSCLEGFCPSFVTVHGGSLRKPEPKKTISPDLPAPAPVKTNGAYSILVAGVGGTGVVTVGSLLGMAAHLAGKGAVVLDQIGLAQKFGTVASHVRIADRPDELFSPHIPAGEANLLLGCDVVASGSFDALAKLSAERSVAVVNTHEDMPPAFIHDRDYVLPECTLKNAIESTVIDGQAFFVDATRHAMALFGDAVAANVFLLGYAWQKGFIPLDQGSIFHAIELNGIAVEQNRQAFLRGRQAAHDPESIQEADDDIQIESLEEIMTRRADCLIDYQDAAYAERYVAMLEKVEKIAASDPEVRGQRLARAVAHNYFKLLAYKDEYEVARLFTRTGFLDELKGRVAGSFKLHFHLAPPILDRKDPATGRPRKREFGPWVLPLFRVLARMKFMRGTPWDIFGYGAERRAERALIENYESMLEKILPLINSDNYDTAVELASLPDRIRGFGVVKRASMDEAAILRESLMKKFQGAEELPAQEIEIDTSSVT